MLMHCDDSFYKTAVADPENPLGVEWVVCVCMWGGGGGGNNNVIERYQGPLMERCGRKEGSVLFSDALNTFYLRLYGVRHVVKDHSDSESYISLPGTLWVFV